jgi:hypothetical protein
VPMGITADNSWVVFLSMILNTISKTDLVLLRGFTLPLQKEKKFFIDFL